MWKLSYEEGHSLPLIVKAPILLGGAGLPGKDAESMKACVQKGNAQPEYFFREGCWITEWANSPADEDASIARVRVEPGQTTRPHRLEGTTERYVILEGKAKIRVEGLPETEVGPGDVVLIPPGATQSLANSGARDLLFLAVCTPRFREENYQDS